MEVTKWEEVMPALNNRKLVLAPWCETTESEEAIKKKTQEESAVEATEASTEEGGAPALTGTPNIRFVRFFIRSRQRHF